MGAKNTARPLQSNGRTVAQGSTNAPIFSRRKTARRRSLWVVPGEPGMLTPILAHPKGACQHAQAFCVYFHLYRCPAVRPSRERKIENWFSFFRCVCPHHPFIDRVGMAGEGGKAVAAPRNASSFSTATARAFFFFSSSIASFAVGLSSLRASHARSPNILHRPGWERGGRPGKGCSGGCNFLPSAPSSGGAERREATGARNGTTSQRCLRWLVPGS